MSSIIAYGQYWNACGECSYINLQFSTTEWYLLCISSVCSQILINAVTVQVPSRGLIGRRLNRMRSYHRLTFESPNS